MTLTDVLPLWILLAGPAAGSFVTALADRHCRGLPLLYGRSQCNSCQHVLSAGDLVPLWSYARLKGRCRYCAAPIPRRVWGGEWAGFGLGLLAVLASADPTAQLFGALYLWTLLGLFQADATCFRLPDALTAPLLVFGLCLGGQRFGISHAAISALVGFAALWALAKGYHLLRKRDGLGFGDVKMMAGLAAASGLAALPWVTLIAALSALARAGLDRLSGKETDALTRIAFGCHLALAGGIVWLSLALLE